MKKDPTKSMLDRRKLRLFSLSILFGIGMLLGTSSMAQVLYSVSNLTGVGYTPITGGTVINSTAQLTAGAQSTNQDDGSALVTLPFTFNYCGTNFTQVTFCTNGWIGFGNQSAVSASNSRAAGNLWTTTEPSNTLGAWMKDMGANFGVGFPGEMVHGSVGTDLYAFEWKNAVGSSFSNTTANLINFQIVLYGPASSNPGRVEYFYGSTAGTTAFAAAIGMEDAVGGSGRFLNALNGSTTVTSTSTAWPGNGNGFRFTPFAPCAPPIDQASALTFGTISTGAIAASFTAAPSAPSGYLVVAYPTGSAVTNPVDATSYLVNQTLGLGRVVSVGTSVSFNATGLLPNQGYDFYVYAYNSTLCSFAPDYNTTSPLSGTATTNACGGPAAGTYTIPTNYATLSAALTDINTNGMLGSVILELEPGYTSGAETFPLTISQNACINALSTLTIRPQAGATALSIAGGNPGATVDLNGADYVTIDGRPGGLGTTSQLSISNSTTTGVAVRLFNDASNNTLTYVDLQGSNVSGAPSLVTLGGVVYMGGADAVFLLGNDNNTISNCSIHGYLATTPAFGIATIGTTTGLASTYNDNNTITNCNIYDYFLATGASGGIKVDVGNTGWSITNNSLYQTAARTITTAGATHRAMWITPNTTTLNDRANAFDITGNFIGGSAPSNGGTAYSVTSTTTAVMYGMDISVGLGTFTSIQNNTISNISFTSTATGTPSFAGISTVNGNVNIGTGTGNTIGSGTATDAIVLNMNGSLGTSFGIRLNGGTSTVLNASNNTIGGITVNTGATTVHNFNGIGCSGGTTTNVTINNNLIGSLTTANSIQMPIVNTSASSQTINGIFISSGPFVSAVTNNTIANLNSNYNGTSTTSFVRGIAVTTSATTVTGNTVRNLSYGGLGTGSGINSGVVGIGVSATTGANTVSNNTIHTLKLTSATATTQKIEITGMLIGGGTFAHNVTRNNIHSLSILSNDTAAVITGIDNSAGTVTFANNMVRLGIDENGTPVTTGCMIRGITKGNSSSCNFWHNSVYIGGSGVTNGVAGSLRQSYAFVRGTNGAADDVRNNIFSNQRSNAGATGATHYAIRLSSGTSGLNLNNNVYYFTGNGGVFGYNGTANVANYAAGWAAGDLLSYETNPQFLAPNGSAFIGDLHINPSVGTLVEQTGTTIASVTEDFDGQIRASLSPNDIGADAGNFISLACTGTPSGGTPSISQSSICAGNAVSLSLSGFTNLPGITFQWQESSTSGGPYANVTGGTGATTGSYTTPVLSNTTYYICVVTCTGSGLSAPSTEAFVTVNNPQILTTTPASICGTGSAALQATATPGATINWYTAPSGGLPVGTGGSFNTPTISATTNYYTSAAIGGIGNTPVPGGNTWNQYTTVGSFQTTTISGASMVFDVLQPLTLSSIDFYPAAAIGSPYTIEVRQGSGTGPLVATYSGVTTVQNVTTPTIAQTANVNWVLPVGTNYVIGFAVNPNTWRGNVTNFPYPFTLPGYFNIQGSSFGTSPGTTLIYQYYLYNYVVNAGCESGRTMVTATVTAPPPTTITSARTIACNDEVVAISETSGNYTSTTWSPTSVLFTNAGGTSPYSGGNNPNVFLRSTTPGNVDVILTATDGVCTEVDTVSVFIQPAAATTSSSPSDLCVSGSVVVNLTPSSPYAANTIQWQSSPTGSGYANIGGATANSYTTPVLTSSTYYQAEVRNSNLDLCFTSTPYEVVVNNPQLLTTTPGSRCGAGTVDLGATASTGATINWYSTPTGGAPIGTGTSFTTPVITATTDFYAAASNGGSTIQGGKPSTNGADGTNTTGGIFFTANQAFTLNSVVMYPTGAGTNTIVLYAGSVTSGTPIYTLNHTFTGAAPTGVTVPINWAITPGTYTIFQSVSGAQCWRDFSGGSSVPATAYPYNIGAACTLTDGTLAGYTYFFYNWTITTGCEGSRTAVTATVNTSPSITAVSGASTICNGNSTTVSVTSSNDPNYTYSWTSTPAGFTASGAGPHTITPTAASTVYTVQAIDNTAGPFAGCGSLSTVTVTTTTNSLTATATATPATVCEGQDAQLNVNVSQGGMSYTMSALTGQTYTPLTGGGITTINTTAQLLSGMGSTTQDDGGVVVTLPFTFDYNGNTFSQMSFCTNGWVGAGNQGTIDAISMRVAGNLFTSTIPNNTIAAWFKDMGANFPTGTGSMRHGLIGTDVYAFQWDNAVGSGFSDGSTILISFQINIHGPASATPGVIDLIYGPTVGTIATAASIGIENATGGTNNYINALTGNGTTTATSSAWPGNGNGYRFTPLPPGGLTYDWSANSNFLSATNIANPVAENVTSAQNYSVLVTQTSTGCTKTANVTLNVSPLPEPSIGSNAPVCQGQDINLFGNNTASGQTTGNSFTWSGPNGFISGSQNPICFRSYSCEYRLLCTHRSKFLWMF
jgi:hypothetical protein